jgi:hypothetical protein
MPKRSRSKKTPEPEVVVGTIGEQPDAELRNVCLSKDERPVVLKGLELLDRRLEKLLGKKNKIPAAVREEVQYWRNLARVVIWKQIEDAEVPDGALLELLALDRTSRMILRGAIDVYTANERAIVPMLKGLGKDDLADKLIAEASRFEADTRQKVVEEDNLELFAGDDDEDDE